MSKFIRLGNTAIKTDSIISAQFNSLDYPYLNQEDFEKQKLAVQCENAGGVFTILGTFDGLALDIGGIISGIEMKTVDSLILRILNGETVRTVLIHNDEEFNCAFQNMKTMRGFHRPSSKYGKACDKFYSTITSIDVSEIYCVEDNLNMFLERLENE